MTMNLTLDPWIPALRADGRCDLLSLHQIFEEAHELRDLAVKPHERIALMRLLLCITHAALDGPANEDDWETSEPLIQPRVRDYLTKWKPAFELFGEGQRFLQFSGLRPGKDSDEGNAATKLDLALATGNNSTLFDNLAGEDRILKSARLALNLLTFQCFAPSGRIGVAKWNGADTAGKGSSNHAPCTPSSMVHTLLIGCSLLSTLRLNLLTRENVLDFHGANRWGEPVWQKPVGSPGDKTASDNAGMSYLGRLVPLSRAVRLAEDGLSTILANGLDYPIFPAFREATSTVIKRKDELALLPASTTRSFWRQLAAISVIRRSRTDMACGPIALIHPITSSEVSIWVGALVMNKKNIAKIEDVVEATYSLPVDMFTDLGRTSYEKGVAYAEELEGVMTQAVKTYASTLRVASPASDRARQRFWTRVEQHLATLFDLARNPNLIADLPNCGWGRAVQAAAYDAYERSCSRQTPRQIQAYALGLRRLSLTSKSTQPNPTSHE